MKKTSKRFIAGLLSLIIVFSIATVPASAVNVYDENTYYGYNEVYDYGNEEDKNFFEKIADTFHWYIARIAFYFERECPICGEHFRPFETDSAEIHYVNGINALKNYEGTVTVAKKQTVNAVTSEAPATVGSLLDSLNEVFSGTTENTYTFVGGVDSEGIKITDVIQPLGRDAILSEDGINESFMQIKSEENRPIDLTAQLISETAHFDGTSTTGAEYNSGVIEQVNLAALDLGTVVINEADITYTATRVFAFFDDFGRVTSIKIEMPLDIRFTAKAAFVSFTAVTHADVTEEYTVTYVS